MDSDEEFTEVFTDNERAAINDEFLRLRDICYLDHAGSALYAESHIKSVANDLCTNTFSNPHSNSSTSRLCSDIIDQVRYRILQHFGTDSNEYCVIFTSGATGAINLVAESFLWKNDVQDLSKDWPSDEKTLSRPQSNVESVAEFVYTEDNHTSVLGMRSLASDRGASRVRCLSHDEAYRLLSRSRGGAGDTPGGCRTSLDGNSLFVYPAQSNFSGLKYPLSWIQKVQSGALDLPDNPLSNWYCLLDAASYVSTNRLDLSVYKPDFVCLSFYKLFGYPTGLGALLVRNSSAGLLRKRYYGGGTVLIALSSHMFHVPRPLLHERLEDGTINFLSVIALQHGFNVFEKLVGTMDKVSMHTFGLARYTFKKLSRLHHFNGNPAVILYVDTQYDDPNTQGNVVNFNLLRPNGDYIGYAEVLHLANLRNIQLRTGCFCNPGACRRHLSLSVEDLKSHFRAGHVCGDDRDLVNGKPTGTVRVSFGYYNTKSDADRLIATIKDCFCTQEGSEFVKMDTAQSSRCIYQLFNDRCLPVHTDGELIVDCFDRPSEVIGPYLSHIFIYPVKSCGKFSVPSWELDSTGLKYDRAWMIVDQNGVALTQKREPKLCLIRPVVDLASQKLYLTFPGVSDLTVGLTARTEDGTCMSKVCSDQVCGIDCGPEASDWLVQVLGRPHLALLRQTQTIRRIKHRRSPGNKPGTLSLANQAQYLLINQSSIKWLSENIVEESDCTKESLLDRFRSNFVVSRVEEPLVELGWSQVNIGSIGFKVDEPCRRCQMICVDQSSGKLTKEPLTTLSHCLGGGKLVFGVYLSALTNNTSTIFVGDRITFQ